MGLLVLHGAAGVLGAPAAQLIIHDMVGFAHLPSVVRLNATSRHLAILLGPAVGGGLMLALGAAWGSPPTSPSTCRSPRSSAAPVHGPRRP